MDYLKKLVKVVNYFFFLARGKKPWTRGYYEYRLKKLKEILAAGRFDPTTLHKGYGLRLDERIVEYLWLLSCLPEGPGRLLDAGSALNFDFLLSQKKLVGKNVFISTLAPETACYWSKGISYVFEDLRFSCFRREYFDWIVSISTVEHIGMDNTMLYTRDASKCEADSDAFLDAIREFRRILRTGGMLYLSVPYGRYENFGWFQVFDASMVDRIIETFCPVVVREYHFRYEPSGWISSSRECSRNATYFDIHKKRSYDSDYAAASRAVVCLEMVK